MDFSNLHIHVVLVILHRSYSQTTESTTEPSTLTTTESAGNQIGMNTWFDSIYIRLLFKLNLYIFQYILKNFFFKEYGFTELVAGIRFKIVSYSEPKPVDKIAYCHGIGKKCHYDDNYLIQTQNFTDGMSPIMNNGSRPENIARSADVRWPRRLVNDSVLNQTLFFPLVPFVFEDSFPGITNIFLPLLII